MISMRSRCPTVETGRMDETDSRMKWTDSRMKWTGTFYSTNPTNMTLYGSLTIDVKTLIHTHSIDYLINSS